LKSEYLEHTDSPLEATVGCSHDAKEKFMECLNMFRREDSDISHTSCPQSSCIRSGTFCCHPRKSIWTTPQERHFIKYPSHPHQRISGACQCRHANANDSQEAKELYNARLLVRIVSRAQPTAQFSGSQRETRLPAKPSQSGTILVYSLENESGQMIFGTKFVLLTKRTLHIVYSLFR
jgi:hypothetical protein